MFFVKVQKLLKSLLTILNRPLWRREKTSYVISTWIHILLVDSLIREHLMHFIHCFKAWSLKILEILKLSLRGLIEAFFLRSQRTGPFKGPSFFIAWLVSFGRCTLSINTEREIVVCYRRGFGSINISIARQIFLFINFLLCAQLFAWCIRTLEYPVFYT